MSVQIIGIPGSLREGSFNRGLLRAAIELAPAEMAIQIFTRLGDIPPYNADVDDRGNPEPVLALKSAIRPYLTTKSFVELRFPRSTE